MRSKDRNIVVNATLHAKPVLMLILVIPAVMINFWMDFVKVALRLMDPTVVHATVKSV